MINDVNKMEVKGQLIKVLDDQVVYENIYQKLFKCFCCKKRF